MALKNKWETVRGSSVLLSYFSNFNGTFSNNFTDIFRITVSQYRSTMYLFLPDD